MLVSIIIRTFNESRYLNELLTAIHGQYAPTFDYEIVLVDSGSTDNTLDIAHRNGCRITHISKSDFTFGRSLNIGCEFARGEILVFISGHCIPTSARWLSTLCQPLINEKADYTYGRQQGRDTTKYSERRHFEKWFPARSIIPQQGFFCNNANAALTRTHWQTYRFNEEVTGLEDMELAKRLVEDNGKVGYVSEASVYHIHTESWEQVRIRYEREAFALQRIMPEVHFTFADFVRYFISGVLADSAIAIREKQFLKYVGEIILFRFNHYLGTFKGSQEHRKLSEQRKKHYFYPTEH